MEEFSPQTYHQYSPVISPNMPQALGLQAKFSLNKVRRLEKEPYVIGVCGGSCSGKSQVTERLKGSLEFMASVVNEFDFYIPQSEDVNYDDPSSIDWNRLEDTLQALSARRPVDYKHYNLKERRFEEETSKIFPTPIIIIEGMFILHNTSIREQLDISIFVDCPDDVRFGNRVRKYVNFYEYDLEYVVNYYLEKTKPAYERFIEPLGDQECDPSCMSSACSFDTSSQSVNSDCASLCAEEQCESFGSSECALACSSVVCGFQREVCGYCASGCFESMLLNSEQDPECNSLECYYDSSLFQECSPGCTYNLLMNTSCDNACNTSLCNFDYGQCIGIELVNEDGCLQGFLGNGICNPECNKAEYSYDDYDCLCANECTPEKLANNVCDRECDFNACDNDNGYCSCPSKCKDSAGDDTCDLDCWTSSCNWIDSDCGCADDCLYSQISSCKGNCLVFDCNFGDMGELGICEDPTRIALARYHQYRYKDFSTYTTIETCTANSADQACTEDKLKNDPTFQNSDGSQPCNIEECAFCMGMCADCSSACEDAALCYPDLSSATDEVICLPCSSDGTVQFYLSCIQDCPFGYKAESNVCIPEADDSSLENPHVYYISSETGTASEPPFNFLAAALARIYHKYAEIVLTANQDHDLTSIVNGDDEYISAFNIDMGNPLSRINYAPKKITIKSDTEGEKANLVINSEHFMTFTVSTGILEFQDIVFTTRHLHSDCSGEACSYCPSPACTEQCYSVPDCSSFSEMHFMTVASTGSLVMNNVKFENMRNSFDALILFANGSLEMNNVDFKQIKVAESSSSSVIKASTCTGNYKNCGSISYNGGLVTLLNDGYDIQIESSYLDFPGFLSSVKIGSVSITNVDFTYNIAYEASLISLNTFDTFQLSGCTFSYNILKGGLLYVLMTDSISYSLQTGTNNTISELTYDHVVISDVTITDSYFVHPNLFYFDYQNSLQNIRLANIDIRNSIFSLGDMIYARFSGSEVYGLKKTYIESRRLLADFPTPTLTIENFNISSSFISSYGILQTYKLENVIINQLTMTDIDEGSVDLESFMLNNFLAQTSSVLPFSEGTSVAMNALGLIEIKATTSLEASNWTIQNFHLEPAVIFLKTISSVVLNNIHVDSISSISTEGIFFLEGVVSTIVQNSIFESITNTQNLGSGAFFLNRLRFESIKFKNCTFKNNSSTFGSAINTSFVTVLIHNCTFESNFGKGNMGGALTNKVDGVQAALSLTITESTFSKNNATSNSGGAMVLTDNSNGSSSILLTISNTTFQGQYSKVGGSDIYIDSGVTLQEGSEIKDSYFTHGVTDLGSISSDGIGSLTIDSCVFYNIVGQSCAGVRLANMLILTIKNTKFINNSGNSVILLDTNLMRKSLYTENIRIEESNGRPVKVSNGYWSDTSSYILNNSNLDPGQTGVMIKSNSEINLTGTTFENNRYDYGSGVYVASNSVLTCTGCTFRNNFAVENGGGIAVEHGTINVKDSVFTQNTALNSYGSCIFINNSQKYTNHIHNTQVYRNNDQLGNPLAFILCTVEVKELDYHDNTSTAVNPGILVNMGTLIAEKSRFYSQSSDKGSVFVATLSTLTIDDCDFYELDSYSSAGAIFAMEASVAIRNSNFYDVQSMKGAAIYAQSSSQVSIENSNFTDILATRTGGLHIEDSSISLTNCSFSSTSGSVIYCKSCSLIEIYSSNITLGSASDGAAVHSDDSYDFLVDNSVFKQLEATIGGAFYISSGNLRSIQISNSIFQENKSEVGGAIYSENYSMNCTNTTFDLNSAITTDTSITNLNSVTTGIGGAVNLKCSSACSFSFSNSTFTSNEATYKGGGINWQDRKPIFSGNYFYNNSAIYGSDIASFPISIERVETVVDSRLLTATSSESIKEVASGQVQTESILLALVDHYGQIIKTDSSSTGSLDSGNPQEVSVLGTTTFIAQNGIFNVSDFIVVAQPNSTTSIAFYTDAIDPELASSTGDTVLYSDVLSIPTEMRSCVLGEVTSRSECIVCDPNTYSLDPSDNECSECPSDVAICYGGSNIVPERGFWRSSNTSEVFWPCPNPDACIGSSASNYSYQGNCATGYKGNKCQSCELGYSRGTANTCTKCPDKEAIVFKFIGILVLLLLVCVFMVKSSLSSAYKPKAMYSVYLKIFINYLQLVMMTASFNLDWPKYVLEFFSVQEQSGSATEQIFSIDCYLENEQGNTDDIFFTKMAFMSMLPLFIIVCSGLFWGVVSLVKHNKRYIKEELVATVIVLIFLVHPNIIKTMFEAINCTEIENGEHWLVLDLDIMCWDDNHSFYAFTIAVPSILIWGLAIPALCFYILYTKRKKLHTLKVRKMYGFLFNGYSKREYYWEIVIMYRKICILCCALIIGTISIAIQALSVMLVILVCIYLQNKYTPYNHQSLNQMEINSILIAACTIYCGLFYLTGDLEEVSKLILFLVIVVVNVYFIVIWLKEMFQFGIKAIALKIPCLRRRFLKTTIDGFDDSIFNLQEVVPHVYGRGVDKMYRLRAESHNNTEQSKLSIKKDLTMKRVFLEAVYNDLTCYELSMSEDESTTTFYSHQFNS